MLNKEDNSVIDYSFKVKNEIYNSLESVKQELKLLNSTIYGVSKFSIDGYLFLKEDDSEEYDSQNWVMLKNKKLFNNRPIVLFGISHYGSIYLPKKHLNILALIKFKECVIKYIKQESDKNIRNLDENMSLIEVFLP